MQIRSTLRAPTLIQVERLILKDVQGGGSNSSFFQSSSQRVFVNQGAARRVDKEGARTHQFNCLTVDHAAIVLIKAAVQRDTVALEEQVLQIVDPFDAEGPFDAVSKVGIVETDAESERLSSNCHRRADATCGESCISLEAGRSHRSFKTPKMKGKIEEEEVRLG